MPKQFLLETVSIQPGDVTDATISSIRPLAKVISVGLLPKSNKNSPAANRVALLSVYDDATDAEVAAISAEVVKLGLAIFVPNKEEAAKKKAAAAAAQESKDKKKGVTKKVSLAETAFTAKATEPAAKKAPVTSSRGGRGGNGAAATAATATADGNTNNRTNSGARGGSSRGRGNNNGSNNSNNNNNSGRQQSSNSRGGRGGRSSSSRGGGRGGRGGRGGGRGGRGGNMANMINRLPTHMQAMMKLAPPSELMYRGAPVGGSNNANNSSAMMMNNMMNNMMMSQQFPQQLQQQQQQGPLPGQTFSSSNLPPNAFAHYGNNNNNNTNQAAPMMMLTGPAPRLWSADVHAVFIANVAPPVTNKQLSLSSGEEIVVVHIERGEDVAIMYVATEQQARTAVQKLNGAFLHDRTLNVSYGGRKVIPLPYPPSHEVQQAQQQASAQNNNSNGAKKQIKNNNANNNGSAAAAVATAKQVDTTAAKAE